MIKVGTCGWSARGGRQAYFRYFEVIELQETFYKLPSEETARHWRGQAPPDFEFTVKAVQAITHPPSSPTWRRSGIKVSSEDFDKYGLFRVTEETLKAWERNLAVCKALGTRVCVFQTPPSFGYSPGNARNVEEFFTTIDRGGLAMGWEPRGTWHEHPSELKQLLSRLDLTHVVDPLRREPVHTAGFAYFRLHGLGGGEVNYRYKYTDEDLLKLLAIVKRYAESQDAYVLFNNVYMFDDALRFKSMLEQAKRSKG